VSPFLDGSAGLESLFKRGIEIGVLAMNEQERRVSGFLKELARRGGTASIEEMACLYGAELGTALESAFNVGKECQRYDLATVTTDGKTVSITARGQEYA
jgi:hypothetical protein